MPLAEHDTHYIKTLSRALEIIGHWFLLHKIPLNLVKKCTLQTSHWPAALLRYTYQSVCYLKKNIAIENTVVCMFSTHQINIVKHSGDWHKTCSAATKAVITLLQFFLVGSVPAVLAFRSTVATGILLSQNPTRSSETWASKTNRPSRNASSDTP